MSVSIHSETTAGVPDTSKRKHRFLNGPQPDMVLVDEVFNSTGTPTDILWLLHDHQNTVTDVATMSSTSGQATLRNHLEYNAFGAITSQTNATYQPLQTFTGQILATTTGLLFYDARWYDPKLGRFVSEDPIEFAPGDGNLFRYVGNSWPNGTDPTGKYGVQVHFYVVYTVFRARGWDHDTAYRAAGWSQYVDDDPATTPFSGLGSTILGIRKYGGENATNELLLKQFHFWGSRKTATTKRNPPDLREKVVLQIGDWYTACAKGGEIDDTHRRRIEARLGVLLHTWADTYAHEGFTAYESPLNRREGSEFRPDRGHADDYEAGNYPDNAYNDVEKALEFAKVLYTLIPRGPEKHVPWHVLEKQLRSSLDISNVPAGVRGDNWDEEANIAAQVQSSQALVKRLFGSDVIYNKADFEKYRGEFYVEMERELEACGSPFESIQ
jgi:RHS repeat-associated protein